MALPKLGVPQYELSMPSTGKTVKYRPFLVKEEKQVIDAVKNVLKSCVISRIKVDQLPSFDLEYLFLKIRAAAIGEVIEMTVTCTDDGSTSATATINIDDVEVIKEEGHDRKIMLTDTTGILMKYPSMDRFIESQFLNKGVDAEHIFSFIAEHIEQIFDEEEVYDSSTTSKKEFREFVESLTSKQFESIQKFYETMPRLSHTFTVVNPNTGNECEYTIEGLQSFFA